MRVRDALTDLRGLAGAGNVPGLTGAAVAAKRTRIQTAIRTKHTSSLRRLAVEAGGLLEDELRKEAWPILLEIDHPPGKLHSKPTTKQLQASPFYDQVVRDVKRTVRRFPPSISSQLRFSLQESLVSVISRVLTAHPELHYYQGYHDVCVTVLLVVNGNEDGAFAIMEHLSRTKLRIFMEPTITGTIRQLSILNPLLGAINGSLRRFLEASNCGVVFLLPWCLTWYGHDITHYPTLTRLFDLFVSTEELMPVYLAAAIILPHQDNLLKQECSLSAVHAYVGRLLPLLEVSHDEIENRVIIAKDLLSRFPPQSLFHVESDRQSSLFRQSPAPPGWESVNRVEEKQVATFLLDDFVLVTYRRDSSDADSEAYEEVETAKDASKLKLDHYNVASDDPTEGALSVRNIPTCGERRFSTMTTKC